MKKRKDTVVAHAGNHPAENHGIVNPPVYHASTVLFPTLAALEGASKMGYDKVRYGRFGTPTTFAFEEAVAALEQGFGTVTYPSGLGAICSVLLALLKAGDHVLMADTAYFPTRRFCEGFLKRYGVRTTFYDPMLGARIAELIEPATRVVFVESPGSLTFEVQDVPAIADAAHRAGAVVVIDNTWSAGYFFQPLKHGVDISLQAATKFLVGHSDAMLGVATCADRATFEIVKGSACELGTCAGPDDCYLGLRGLRTLAARMDRHQATGLKLAAWLKGRPEVEAVYHPALPGNPGHEFWKRDFSGACGLFSFVLRPVEKTALAAMLDGLEVFGIGYSWGGYESLIVPAHPEASRSATRWPHAGPVLRIHAGLEDADDLIADLASGLKRLAGL